MAPRTTHPVDPIIADLLDTYTRSMVRVSLLVEDGLRRGLDPLRAGTADAMPGDATQAYRARQLEAIRTALAGLRSETLPRAATGIERGFLATVRATDVVTGQAPAYRLTASHARTVARITANLTRSLEAAAATTGQRVEDVFAIADALAGGLPADRTELARGVFLGRRVDDQYRAATLRSIAAGLAQAEPRATISAQVVDRLIREGVTDATTGFIDRAGRRWSLDDYSRMAVRTTTREAVSAASEQRMRENGVTMVEISAHPNAADVCLPWEGRSWPIDEVEWPPYHPNCLHVATPAGVNLDDYEAELDARLADLGAV